MPIGFGREFLSRSEINADLVVDSTAKEPFWLENIGIVALPQPGQSPLAVNQNFAQIGHRHLISL